ncbi:MAG: tetratricopeptide repeat protein [Gemmataceae bacterium]
MTRSIAAVLLICFTGLVSLGCIRADEPTVDELLRQGSAHLSKRENEKAVAYYTAAIKDDPKQVEAYDRRGDAYLKLGRFKEAVADFDTFLEAKPKFAPEHWRRGIALYYLGRFEDGVKQFETHKTVNPQDVENAAWHYLCNVHVVGKDKAKAALIDVTRDRRVPMAEIQKLFAGSMTPADVLAAAEKTSEKSEAGIEARFYANLYVALWYEAEKNDAKRTEHLTKAVESYKIGHYMWDVGNAHLAMIKAKASGVKKP